MSLLTPAEIQEAKRAAVAGIRYEILAAIDPVQINTIELSTAAHALGLSVKDAARKLPIIELGPRSRVVDLKDFIAFKEARKTYPEGWPREEPLNPSAA